MKLRSKLGLAIFFGSAIPLALAMVVTLRQAREGTQAITLRSAQAIVDTAAERLSSYFGQRKAEARVLAQDPTLQTMDPRTFRPLLQAWKASKSDVYEKFILGLPDGRFYNTEGGNPALGGLQSFDNRDPHAAPRLITGRDYWIRTLGENPKGEARVYVSNPNIAMSNGVPQVIVAATIRDPRGKAVGALGCGVRLATVRSIVDQVGADLFQEFGSRAAAFLVSPDGSYVHRGIPGKALPPFETPNPAPNILQEKDPTLRAAGADMVAGRFGCRPYRAASGEHRYLIHAPVAAAGYSVAVDVPSEVIWERSGRLVWVFTSALLASLALAAIGSLVLSHRIADPVLTLTRAARGIAAGDFSQPMELRGRDEVAQLARAFQTMAREVSSRERELKDSRSQLEELVQELRTAQGQALEAYRAKQRFLANTSHELRTPLNAIILLSEILEMDALATDQGGSASDLRHIHQAGKQLLALIDDILAFAQLEGGKLQLHPESFSLAASLRHVHGKYLPMAQRKGLELRLEAEGLPAEVLGDGSRVRQILENLVDNALKFTPPPPKSPGLVVLRAHPLPPEGGGLRIRFQVEDTGSGISFEARSKLFEPFTQEDDSLTRRPGGTGLGLAICLRLAARMGGQIQVESVPGQGTTFTVDLPFDPEKDAPGTSG